MPVMIDITAVNLYFKKIDFALRRWTPLFNC